MSDASVYWVLGALGVTVLLAVGATGVAIVRRRDPPGWPAFALAALGAVPLAVVPLDRVHVIGPIQEGQVAPWVLAVLLGLWLPAALIPATLHPGPDARGTPGRAGAALAVGALVLVPTAILEPSPVPIVLVPLIGALVASALRTSERLVVQRRIGALLAVSAAAAVLGASAVWAASTDAEIAWSVLGLALTAAAVTDRPGRLAGGFAAVLVLCAVHQLHVTRGAVEAWLWELRGGQLPVVAGAALRPYEPMEVAATDFDGLGSWTLTLVDARTPWADLTPARRYGPFRILVRDADGYAVHDLLVADLAPAVEVVRLDEDRFTVGGGPPMPIDRLNEAVSAAAASCGDFVLVAFEGEWTVGDVVRVERGVVDTPVGTTCSWNGGGWEEVELPPVDTGVIAPR